MRNSDRPDSILKFWFGERPIPETPQYFKERIDLWFGGSPSTDEKIRNLFGPVVETAAGGKLEEWKSEPESALAWIILMDQFSLNIYRDEPRSFEQSAMAIPLSRSMIAQGWDLRFHPVQRTFIYLPLEHSEVLADQEESVALFEKLKDSVGDEAPEALRQAVKSFHWYAVEHWKVVKRFGRFPDRNAIFGRSNTDEEAAYLASGGPPF